MMKRRYLVYFVIAGYFLGSFFGAIFGNVVSALPSNWVELDDFDGYNIDDVNGTNGNFVFNCTLNVGTSWAIKGSAEPGGDKYLRTDYNGDDTQGWFNITNNGYYGYYICLKMHNPSLDTYTFYNQTNVEIIDFKTDIDEKVYYKDSAGNYQLIYDGVVDTIYYVSWQYYTENVIQYKIYDSNFVLKAITNGTGLIKGIDYTNKSQFNSSTMFINAHSSYAGEFTYIYEYGYISEDLEFEYGDCGIDGVVFWTNGILGLKDVVTGAIANYQLDVYSSGVDTGVNIRIYYPFNELAFYTTFWTDESPETVYFYYDFKSHYPTGEWYFQIWDYCDFTMFGNYSFNASSYLNEDVEEIWFNGDPFAEFDRLTKYYYFDGDPVRFWYWLPFNSSASNIYEDYCYGIVLYRDSLYVKSAVFTMNDLNRTTLVDALYGEFPGEGNYYLQIYNLSSSSSRSGFGVSSIIGYPLVYTSDMMYVYDRSSDGDDDGVPDDEDPDGGTDDSDFVLFDGLGSGMKIMLGLFITVAVGVGLLVVTHVPLVMPVTMVPMVYVFSQPSLALFDPVVGTGLIVCLVLVGFIMWLFG